MAQLRFKEGRCLDDNLYVRGDSTLVNFTTVGIFKFIKENVNELFQNCGFKIIKSDYDKRLLVNRKRKLTMFRVWIQSKFQLI